MDQEETPQERKYADLFASVEKSGGTTTGKYFEMLTADEKKDVLAFAEWLKTTSMSQASRSSYKSYITKAMLKARGVLSEELTNDEKSGVRKFQEWSATQDVSESGEEE